MDVKFYPQKPEAYRPLTIIYQGRIGDNAKIMRIHGGYGSTNWEEVFDLPMSLWPDNGWTINIAVLPHKLLNIAFHDGEGNWEEPIQLPIISP
ncbi:MAG: hypothetical protein ACOX29_00750 [Bacillota bacterium]|jgi:hypothetical protein|nr:hypothetical protein [Bacillota bacterium]NLU55301.1 hypothetical protein [Bacillota bacterium]HOA91884.1 hypothetical protein [Bacillota bacterium]HOJ45897.1 hypothetical protein [Bacillota bacterium]HOL13288.1 hypothetical protein [Bacillota bacterium]